MRDLLPIACAHIALSGSGLIVQVINPLGGERSTPFISFALELNAIDESYLNFPSAPGEL